MIVFPMVGLSSRFFKAGYKRPKYQLEINGQSVLSLAIGSFSQYFSTEKFIFITRQDHNASEYVRKEVEKVGIIDYEIHILDCDTAGQAETVYLGLKLVSDSSPVYIFNVDTVRHAYQKPNFVNDCDGYLEVFRGEGNHWSFVKPSDGYIVKETAEKVRISDLCSDGLYYFKDRSDFEWAYLEAKKNGLTINGEYYIAPLYNLLIERGKNIVFDIIDIDSVDFCGTPDEYEGLKKKYSHLT